MASKAGAVRAGRAFVELFADDSALAKGLRAAQARLRRFAASVTAIGRRMMIVGAAITGPLLAAAAKFASMGDELGKMNKRTGVAVESLSALGFAAGRSGAGLEAVEKGLRGMARMLLTAEQGSKEAVDSLAALGLTVKDLQGLDPESQFKLLASRLEAIPDPTRKAGLAMRLFGRSGVDLIPMLADVEALTDKARELNIVMSTEDVRLAEALTDAWGDVKEQFAAITSQIGAGLAPALISIQEAIAPILADVIDWVKENRGLVVSLFTAGVVITAAGAALVGLGIAAKLAAIGLGVMLAALQFVVSPLGILTTGIIAGTVALLKFTDVGRAMANVFRRTIGAVFDALAGGDLKLAGEVAMAGLKLAWQTGVNALATIWTDFKISTAQTMVALVQNLNEIWVKGVATMQRAWVRMWESFKVSGFTESLADFFLNMMGQLGLIDNVDQARQTLKEDMARGRGNLDKTIQEQLNAISAEEKKRLAKGGGGIIDALEEDRKREKAALKELLEPLSADFNRLVELAASSRRKMEEGLDAAAAGDALGMLGGGGRSVGTFSAAAVRGLFGGPSSPQKKTNDLLAQANKILKAIEGKVGKPLVVE